MRIDPEIPMPEIRIGDMLIAIFQAQCPILGEHVARSDPGIQIEIETLAHNSWIYVCEHEAAPRLSVRNQQTRRLDEIVARPYRRSRDITSRAVKNAAAKSLSCNFKISPPPSCSLGIAKHVAQLKLCKRVMYRRPPFHCD